MSGRRPSSLSSFAPTPRSKKILFLFLFLFYAVASFLHPPSLFSSGLHTFHHTAMGTVVEMTLVGQQQDAAEKAALRAFHEIKRIEHLMSPWVESSDVSHINRSAGRSGVTVAQETLEVIEQAQRISYLSGGAFDITAGPLVQLWKKAREKGSPPETAEIKETLRLVDFRGIGVRSGKIYLKKKGMAIDLGGIAKGYAVDRASHLLRSLGYQNFILNVGGDLRAEGTKGGAPWSIGIQHPRNPEKVRAKISVSGRAVATSGDYEKFFIHQGTRFHHILNPKTGLPADGCQSVTILSSDCTMADALATALFVLGPDKGFALCQKISGLDCFMIDKDGNEKFSPGLRGQIIVTDEPLDF